MDHFYEFTEIRDNKFSKILISKNAADSNNQLPRIFSLQYLEELEREDNRIN